jgi:hypothetical protein
MKTINQLQRERIKLLGEIIKYNVQRIKIIQKEKKINEEEIEIILRVIELSNK